MTTRQKLTAHLARIAYRKALARKQKASRGDRRKAQYRLEEAMTERLRAGA